MIVLLFQNFQQLWVEGEKAGILPACIGRVHVNEALLVLEEHWAA
jgi:hypothetical protein